MCTTGGRCRTWAGLMCTPLPICATALRGRCCSSLASREAKIVPKIATPNEPPTERKNVAVEVATPMSARPTSFWTTSTSTCITRPIPTPITSMYTDASHGAVFTPSCVSIAIPAARIAVPAIGNTL